VHKTPPRFLGLVGARPDERTLPLSQRLENYRDTEASALAIFTSGNGLELLHSKAIPHWGWVAFWIGALFPIYFIPVVLPGLEAWMDMQFGRLSFSMPFGILALLMLVSRTGRMFVHLLQRVFPLCAFAWWVGFSVRGATTGEWSLAALWGAAFTASTLLLWFRTRLFLRGFITVFAACAIDPALACIHSDNRGAVHAKTYAECVVAGYQSLAVTLGLDVAVVLFLIGRQLANNAFAW